MAELCESCHQKMDAQAAFVHGPAIRVNHRWGFAADNSRDVHGNAGEGDYAGANFARCVDSGAGYACR